MNTKKWKRILMWGCCAVTTYLFLRIAQQLYDNQQSETRFFIGMIYFSWLAVMLK